MASDEYLQPHSQCYHGPQLELSDDDQEFTALWAPTAHWSAATGHDSSGLTAVWFYLVKVLKRFSMKNAA